MASEAQFFNYSYSADKPLLYLCTVTVGTVTLLISICRA